MVFCPRASQEGNLVLIYSDDGVRRLFMMIVFSFFCRASQYVVMQLEHREISVFGLKVQLKGIDRGTASKQCDQSEQNCF